MEETPLLRSRCWVVHSTINDFLPHISMEISKKESKDCEISEGQRCTVLQWIPIVCILCRLTELQLVWEEAKNSQWSRSHTRVRICTWSPATERTHVNPRAKEADTGGSLGTVGSCLAKPASSRFGERLCLRREGRRCRKTLEVSFCAPPQWSEDRHYQC